MRCLITVKLKQYEIKYAKMHAKYLAFDMPIQVPDDIVGVVLPLLYIKQREYNTI